MLDYAKTLAQLTEQLGFPEEGLASFGEFVHGLRPAQKALVCVGAATVACMLVGLTVKSLKKRGKDKGTENGAVRKRMSIDILSGQPLMPDLQVEGMDKEDTWLPQDLLQVDQGFGELDAIANI